MDVNDAADEPRGAFECSWSRAGANAAWVLVAGELDSTTSPRLGQTLFAALRHARLVAVNLRELTCIDSAGVQVIVDASCHADRAGGRLILSPGPPHIEAVFAATATLGCLELLSPHPATSDDLPPAPTARATQPDGDPDFNRWIHPLDNPVNAGVLPARLMAVADTRFWLHVADGAVQRAWAPDGSHALIPPGTAIEIYLDGHGEINGWRDPDSGLAVNQRRLDRAAPPATGTPMVCQGPCGVVWQAPAAAQLEKYDEHCLTCAGALAPG